MTRFISDGSEPCYSIDVRRIYARPVALCLASSFGLIVALLGDGFWNVLGWSCLALPLVVAAYEMRRSWSGTSPSTNDAVR